MADKVGDAYVDLHMRGRHLDRAVSRLARDNARQYTSEFGKEVDATADRNLARGRQAIADALASGSFEPLKREFKDLDLAMKDIDRQFKVFYQQNLGKNGRREIDNFRNQVDSLIKTWRQYESDQQEMLENRTAQKRIEDQERAWASYGRNVQYTLNREKRALADQEKAWQSYSRNVLYVMDTQDRVRREQEAAWLTYGRNVNAALKADALREQEEAWRTYSRNMQVALQQGEDIDRLTRKWGEHGVVIQRALDDAHVKRQRRSLVLLGNVFDTFPDRVGRAFGRGARNDFINLIGATVRGLAMVPATIGRAFKAVYDRIDDGLAVFKVLRLQGEGLAVAISGGLRAAMAGILPVLGLFVAGFVAASFAVPAIVSGLLMLGGAIISVAGAISFALSGWILPLVPALLGLVGPIGLVIGSMVLLGQEVPEVVEAFRPLTNLGGELARAFTPAAAEAGRQLSKIVPLLEERLIPGLGDLAMRASDHFLGRFTNLLNGEVLGHAVEDGITAVDMDPFFAQWGKSLGRITDSISHAFAELSVGLIAFFTPVLPYAERLAKGIEDAFTNFRTWAQSTEGQNSIAEFMEKAWYAGEKLWGTITNIAGIIGSLFDISFTEGGGEDFLAYLERVTGEFDKWLKSPEGRESAVSWFQDVAAFGGEIKNALEGVIEIIQELDSEESRANITNFIEAINEILPIIASLASGITEFIQGILDAWEQLIWELDRILESIPGMGDGIEDSPFDRWQAQLEETRVSWRQLRWEIGNWVMDSNPFKPAADTVQRLYDFATSGYGQTQGYTNPSTGRYERFENQITLLDYVLQKQEQMEQKAPYKRIAEGISEAYKRIIDSSRMMPESIEGALSGIEGGMYAPFARGSQESLARLGEFYNSSENAARRIVEVFGVNLDTLPSRVTGPFGMATSTGLAQMGDFAERMSGAASTIVSATGLGLAPIVGTVFDKVALARNAAMSESERMAGGISSKAGEIPGRAGSAMSSMSEKIGFQISVARAAAILATIALKIAITTRLDDIPGAASSALSGLASAIGYQMGRALSVAQSYASRIRSTIASASGAARGGGGGVSPVPLASGGMVTSPTYALVGEAGPEAIIPLTRALNQIDPSVRNLAAALRGEDNAGVTQAGKVVNVHPGAIVVTPRAADPVLVAHSILDDLAVSIG